MSDTTLPRAATRPAADARGGRLHGMDLLRVVASCLVVYTHVHAWFVIRGRDWWFTDLVESNIVGTFHLNSRLSFVGVAIFLVISGVVVTYVTDRESPVQFVVRRIVRLAPLLWVVTFLAWVAINLGQRVSGAEDPALGVGDLLLGTVLGNFFTTPQIGLVGVTWTLLIQVGFYCYVAAAIPLLRRQPWIPPLVAATGCFIGLLLITGTRSAALLQVGKVVAYLPILCMGQLISLTHTRRVRPAAGIAIGLVHAALFTWADTLGSYTSQGDAMPRTVLLVVLVTVVMIRSSGRISRAALVGAWSKRTYAIYLAHLGCIFVVMDHLVPIVGSDVSVLVAVVAVAAVAELLHRLVEMPAVRWVRRRQQRDRTTRTSGDA